MMDLQVEFEGVEEIRMGILSALSAGRLRQRLWRTLRKWSFYLERLIKTDMPVDTGRARSSWGHWSGNKSILNPKSRKYFNPKANKDDAVWEEDEAALTITQGTNVEYVPALNEGHSSQAPAGFIDNHFEEVKEDLLNEVMELLDEWGRS